MPKQSAGLLAYRHASTQLEVFLVHPGGPYWKNKDAGAWSIPKGELGDAEDPLEGARREFTEETGVVISGPFAPLGQVRQSGGKVIHAFAVAADFDATTIVSNTFEMEWPPRTGRLATFPEVDRAAWFSPGQATGMINPAQAEFLRRLCTALELAKG